MYCQSCGAQNTDDARFCNMCGAPIAAAGAPGGPVAEPTALGAAPPPHEGKATAVGKRGATPAGGDHSATVAAKPGARSPEPDTLVDPPSGERPSLPDGGRTRVEVPRRPEPITSIEDPRRRVAAGDVPRSPSAAAASRPAPAPHPKKVPPPKDVPPWVYNPSEAQVSETLANAPRPYSTTSGSGVSLAAVGIQDTRRTWLALALAGLGLVGLGAGITFAITGSSDPPPAAAAEGTAEASDPFVIGTPLPEGADTPDPEPAPPPGGGDTVPEGSSEPAWDPGDDEPEEGSGRRRRRRRSGDSEAASAMSGGGDEGESGASSMEGSSSMEPGEPAEEDLYGARVRFAVRRYYAARAQQCFERATGSNPTLSGTVVVSMTIGSDGSVSAASPRRNTTGDQDLAACLAGQVRTWRLPPPPSGEVTMQMPFSR